MLWIFERGHESRKVETRFDNARGEYVLIRHLQGGDHAIERFVDATTFEQRIADLQAELAADRWEQKGPIVLRDGWRVG
jgi:hypothetical protein